MMRFRESKNTLQLTPNNLAAPQSKTTYGQENKFLEKIWLYGRIISHNTTQFNNKIK